MVYAGLSQWRVEALAQLLQGGIRIFQSNLRHPAQGLRQVLEAIMNPQEFNILHLPGCRGDGLGYIGGLAVTRRFTAPRISFRIRMFSRFIRDTGASQTFSRFTMPEPSFK